MLSAGAQRRFLVSKAREFAHLGLARGHISHAAVQCSAVFDGAELGSA